ncbi:uncharacterized protein B0I36DRAFT_251289 [Microdochium trichocladiopsis]|uniref:chitinase n=1 Tax=Microdochium trichocladiopsis TaxID=1682393 RepID=A0A9P8XZL7_9PEZI|nr:uncharacterized protein B0I36DRAFT_251289 [Microdochium trichocladiopsis]KAH7024975.1 hypothetical protein B0I36DRAFT_251289 [Microdochium trichocladiopsis]
MHLSARPWPAVALAAVLGLVAQPSAALRLGASPTYANIDICPDACSKVGPDMNKWAVYPDMRRMKKCGRTMFYRLSLNDPVDDNIKGSHRISACSSHGPDFETMAANVTALSLPPNTTTTEVSFEIGVAAEADTGISSNQTLLVQQIRQYVDGGPGNSADQPFVMFGQSGNATVGIYVGLGLPNHDISQAALGALEQALSTSESALTMQLCGANRTSSETFGIMLANDGKFGAIQKAVKAWSKAECVPLDKPTKVAGEVHLTTQRPPPPPITGGNTNTTRSAFSRRWRAATGAARNIQARDDCRTVQVVSGDNCGTLAAKCGVSGSDFESYNKVDNFCSSLKPKQHVCCSSGSMPDFAPKPNPDGSCKAYTIVQDDNCDNLAAEYSLTKPDLEEFNKKTWGWNGCQLLFTGTIMCLSKGTPPFPAEIPNAVCGPQKPGTKDPKDGKDVAELNPCPLNACCNIWGQCGITKDFCIDTNTGAPGTAEPDTYGCISNCGLDVVKGDGGGSIRVGYFEGYSLGGRKCLHQDASQIDTNAYTHLHFGFGTLTQDFDVETGDTLSTYEFEQFKKVKGPKRILSFGGWDFSTMPATYMIFPNAVKPANRVYSAFKIASFIKKHDLDGVDIDWEYPGAPDIPGLPPASLDDGPNYLAFLVLLKNLLPGKSVSIAAPSSYWYLKQYPIKEIGAVVDYIVYMTYDLHGQWDTENHYSQEGCDFGNCLRSQVNLTETKQSLAMITKAGVPGRKVIVGVTSYGRTYKMADAGCAGPGCTYLGDPKTSPAKKGVCTDTAGYLADAEINEIIDDRRRAGRVVTQYKDASSNSDILVYDDGEWVSWMNPSTKSARAALYAGWGLGGTTDWAVSQQKYYDPPGGSANWAVFKQAALNGDDPVELDPTRNGDWTNKTCTDRWVENEDHVENEVTEMWNGLAGDSAWADVKRIWLAERGKGGTFLSSVHGTLKIEADSAECDKIDGSDCGTGGCAAGMNGPLSGPAGMMIWKSLIMIRLGYSNLHAALFQAASTYSLGMKKMLDTFAPIPPKDNSDFLLLVDLLTLGTLAVGGPIFNGFIKQLPKFVNNPKAYDNLKDTTMLLAGQQAAFAKDFTPEDKKQFKVGEWTATGQTEFSAFMEQIIKGWAALAEESWKKTINGSDASVAMIEKAIAGGRLYPKLSSPKSTSSSDAINAIGKALYGFSIPELWRRSQTYAFILDSGASCDQKDPIPRWMNSKNQEASGFCYLNRLYYLAAPNGSADSCEDTSDEDCQGAKFGLPKGLDALGKDGSFGGLTKDDIIKGSLRTFFANNFKNEGRTGQTDISASMIQGELLQTDITIPGFIRLPVCYPDVAFASWDLVDEIGHQRGATPNWPCDALEGNKLCGTETYRDETKSDSPSVEDCMQIVKTITPDTDTQWTMEVVGKKWREIGKGGHCRFSVRASKINGNIVFYVGGQDVIDIIKEAVKQYGKSGKVAAGGNFDCGGSAVKQYAEWKIYYAK